MGNFFSETEQRAEIDDVKTILENKFPLAGCLNSGSNANTEDARILEAIYSTQSCDLAKHCNDCKNLKRAYVCVGLQYMPFCILEESTLGGISENYIIMVDYDETQIHTAKAITEVIFLNFVTKSCHFRGYFCHFWFHIQK